MSKTIHLDKPDAFTASILRSAFPDYTGRKFKLAVHGSDSPFRLSGNYWDGGSRSYYAFVNLENGRAMSIGGTHPVFEGPEREGVIPANVAIVEHSIFCGKDSGLTVHISELSAAPLLPAVTELSRHEQIVLVATRGLKSSYNGISDYRCHKARETTGISKAEYEAAKLELVTKGMLDKRGSITASGRNAVSEINSLYSLKESGQ
jgi:hypothetical protein